MYTIKQIPEDFLVWELPEYELDEKGIYAYFWLRKENYNTLNAIRQIALKLNLPLKNIGFAGNKDKLAITEQVISIRAIKKERIERLKLKDIELNYIGQGKDPISLGDLEGNRFKITVRNLPSKRLLLKKPDRVPNLFGKQRFSKHNSEIGKFIVTKNFRNAVDLIDNLDVQDYIVDKPGDPIGALRQLPLKLLRLYVHAYQSLIWNKTIEEYMKEKPFKNEFIPIVGFGTELRNEKVDKIIRILLNKERIVLRDFIIPQVKEVSAEGDKRALYMIPRNLKVDTDKDELNEYKSKATISFTLSKGCYATTVINFLFEKLP